MEIPYFTSGSFLLPTGPAHGITVASHSSVNTYGSWVEFTSSLTEDSFLYAINHYLNLTGAKYAQIQIGVGAAGAEVVKHTDYRFAYTENTVISGLGQVPMLRLSAGARISVRVADGNASADDHRLTLLFLPVASVINPVLSEVSNPTFTVASDGSNSATSFKIAFTGAGAATDQLINRVITFADDTTTAQLRGQPRLITAYNATTNFITVAAAFTTTPVSGDSGRLISR